MVNLLEAYMGKEPFFFISYAHADNLIVIPELKKIQENKFRIWFDQGLPTAKIWYQSIEDRLSNCCGFIVFFTANSIESESVRNEIFFAKTKKKCIIQVFLEPCELKYGLDFALSHIQAIMKYEMDPQAYYKKLFSSLKECLEGSLPKRDDINPPQILPIKIGIGDILLQIPKIELKWYCEYRKIPKSGTIDQIINRILVLQPDLDEILENVSTHVLQETCKKLNLPVKRTKPEIISLLIRTIGDNLDITKSGDEILKIDETSLSEELQEEEETEVETPEPEEPLIEVDEKEEDNAAEGTSTSSNIAEIEDILMLISKPILKDHCGWKKMAVSGTKRELVHRILTYNPDYDEILELASKSLLKTACEQLGIKVSGSKEDLKLRIITHFGYIDNSMLDTSKSNKLRNFLLNTLGKSELVMISEYFGLPKSGNKQSIAERILQENKDLKAILVALPRDILKDICDALGFTVSGNKEELINKILTNF